MQSRMEFEEVKKTEDMKDDELYRRLKWAMRDGKVDDPATRGMMFGFMRSFNRNGVSHKQRSFAVKFVSELRRSCEEYHIDYLDVEECREMAENWSEF